MRPVYFQVDGQIVRCMTEYSVSVWATGNAVKLSSKEGQAAYMEQQKASLYDILQKAKHDSDSAVTVYTIIRTVSRSGMSRNIDLFIVVGGEIRCITHGVAEVCGYKLGSARGVIVGGCGMDMAFSVVDNLKRAMNLDLRHEAM